jgi:hypothetical protein
MIVGIKTEAFKDWVWTWLGGKWRKARFFDVSKFELHPTKGWRRIFHVRNPVDERTWERAPATERRWQQAKRASRRGLFADGSRLQLNRDLVEIQFKGSTRHLQRHGWYQRQQRKLANA